MPDLSIIIPAFNEAVRLPHTLARLRSAAPALARDLEIVVVDDGSADGTAATARRVAAGWSRLRVFEHRANRGKGAAVATGMLRARGRVRLFLDADLPVEPADLRRVIRAVGPAADVAIARRGRGWSAPLHRRMLSRLYRGTVGRLLIPGIHDTQCGCKAFSARAARRVFGALSITDFSFDVEALLLARRFGFAIAQIPVAVRHERRSSVRLVRDGLRMGASMAGLWIRRARYRPLSARAASAGRTPRGSGPAGADRTR